MSREVYTLTPEDEYIFDLSRTWEVAPDGTILKCASFFTSFYIRMPGEESGWEFDSNIDPPWQLKFHHSPQKDKTVIGGFGSGKAQPLDSLVLTPTGWVRMGDIRVGDQVIGSNGKPTRVLGVFPQGQQSVVRVTLTDGTSVECSEDHLWSVWTNKTKSRNRPNKVLTAREMADNLYIYHKSGRITRYFLPLVGPIEFEERPVPLDPYVLGILIGGGGMSQERTVVSSSDPEIVNRIASSVPAPCRIEHLSGYDYSITVGNLSGNGRHKNPVAAALREMGLRGCRSESKFIPDLYKFNSPHTRLELLRGILDADGAVSGRSAIDFVTTSPRLARDVQFLVQSFGGYATLSEKKTSYRHNGNVREGQPAYRLYIRMPDHINPFWVSRKRSRLEPSAQRQPVRGIASIEPVGKKECQCILVDAPDHLYVTENCIVTHNTVGVAMSYLTHATLTPDFKFMNVAPTGWQSKQMYDTLMTELEGTIFAERFLWKAVEKPFPKITIQYRLPNRKREDGKIIPGRLVRSTMEFMSMSEDARRILTWEGDAINIDQGEQHDSLMDAIVALGSRLRGQIRGRERMAQLSILANSEDNPELWWWFDQGIAEEGGDPNEYLSIQVATQSNRNLTEQQIKGIMRRIKDPTKLAQYLGGQRPELKGEEFSGQMVADATDPHLDEIMEAGLKEGNDLYELKKDREAGVVLWRLPPIPGHEYVVIGDPGTGKPPSRNAPVVIVLDMTFYGDDDGAATLAAFWWGNGGGRFHPFLDQFLTWRAEYKAVGAAYDATAGQKVHSEISFKGMDDIIGIDMSGSGVKKKQFINTLKLLMLRGKLKWPKGIMGLHNQFKKYRLPDEKIPQDIVSAFIVFAGYLWWLGLDGTLTDDREEDRPLPPSVRSRYSRHNLERYASIGRVQRR